MKSKSTPLYLVLLAGSALCAEEPRNKPSGGDPFVRGQKTVAEIPASVPKVISICFESFSLDINEAAEIYHGEGNDTELYKAIVSRINEGKGKREVFAVVSSRSGEKSTVESISEFIYPTEFEPAELPNTVGVSISPPKPAGDVQAPPAVPDTGKLEDAPAAAQLGKLSTPATPTQFETRNVGISLEFEATLAQNERIIDLRIAPDLVTLAERTKWGKGDSEGEMPNFETQRLNTASVLMAGQPRLLGTPSRPPVSKIDADSANRIWFAFVTAKVVPVIQE